MNSIIQDYLHALRRRLGHLGLRERDAVLKEIQVHLDSEMKRLRAEDTGVSADEAALQATNAFGDPDEIGVAYGAHGGVINRSTGELLLEVAILTSRATGRGVKGVLKWTGIIAVSVLGVALILVLAGLLFAGQIINTFQDDIRGNVPHPLYSYTGSWDALDPHTEVTSDTFEVRDGVREFIIDFDIQPDLAGGCARVMLLSPTGTSAYDSGTDCSADSTMLTLSQKGTWTVQYTFVAYTGTVDVQAVYFESVVRQS